MWSKDGLSAGVLYSGIPNGIATVDIGVLPIQRSCSGGSYSSDRSLYSSSNATAHQTDQGTKINCLVNVHINGSTILIHD